MIASYTAKLVSKTAGITKNPSQVQRSFWHEEASGQKINTDKSSLFFSRNTKEEKREEVKDILGSMQDTQPKKYLGLPSMIGRSKKQVFNEIKERVGKKLMGWKEKLLSIGVREIKVVA